MARARRRCPAGSGTRRPAIGRGRSCDDDAVRPVALAVLVGCKFHAVAERAGADGNALDVAAGDAQPAMPCPSDPHLRVCFSFDAPSFGATLANEGAAQDAAQLTNVTRSVRGRGGAVELGMTSEIMVAPTDQAPTILTAEIWFRI